jgi:DNA (cytosine-5)-methyltransferase 1
MRHGSLFSGIGGFDLAAEWMGWENVFHCEWNTFGQKVLKYYWPKSISYEDITKTDFTIHRGNIDILTGGFPCQPYSSAGKRLGKEDERHLWPEMLRAIREVQPSWVVGENVRGLTNWNGGMVFDEVQAELETQGYEVLPFLLPACAVNAPHRRDRIWFVAYSNNPRTDIGMRNQQQWPEVNNRWEGQSRFEFRKDCCNGYDSNTNGNGLNKCNGNNEIYPGERRLNALGDINEGNDNGDFADTKNIRQEYALENGQLEGRRPGQPNQRNAWDSFPSVSPICNGDDGLSYRLDSITFPKWRNESIKAGGNAIVPQVVHQIFKAIEEYERITTANTN